MNRFKLASLCLSALALIAMPACGDRTNGTSDSEGSTGQGGSTSSGETPTTTDPTTPTSTEPQTSGTGTGGETDAMTTEPTSSTGEVCQDVMLGQPNDATCADVTGCGCASGKCFVVPILGGFCGECLNDADCNGGGCTVPNPIAKVGSTCNGGEPGAGCETNDVCTDPANLNCGTLLEVMGIIKVATCGECSTNADCVDPALPNCTPTYDVEKFTGKYVCAADASVPNAEGCNLADDGNGDPIGNVACMSGFCGDATVMDLLHVGVCGECNSNADCPVDKPKCNDAQVDLNAAALVAAFCSK
ncbi:hypothetical protein [Nannocystis sp.]|uniref:hypothetical protein n=1 Tax=Nannocystis sp. TaxID=1962667 RepID=UPI002427F570|nr:hypothetical protein [Nannocystis sp.]MBK7826468.1 hypothetical protein [Nannocystis sp.]MBK9757984.1 hypothetical protein [Nannocystis sp.]